MPLLSEAFQIIENPQPSLLKDLEEFTQKFWGSEHESLESVDHHFFAKDRAVILVYPQNEIIGHLFIYTRPINFGGKTYKLGGIGSMLVHPRYRRRGISIMMLEKAEEYFKANGVDFALITTGNQKLSHRFYRFGFKPLGKSFELVDKQGQALPIATGMILPINNQDVVTEILSSPDPLIIPEPAY